MSIAGHKHMSEGDVVRARRIEVFTGAGRRRAWTPDEKAAIVAESFDPSTSVSQVARNHGLTPTQLDASIYAAAVAVLMGEAQISAPERGVFFR